MLRAPRPVARRAFPLPLLIPLLLVAAGVAAPCDPGVPGIPPPPGASAADFRLPALHAEPDPVAGGRIVDAHGREVLLRGVNVNAFVEYWAYAPALFTTYPFTGRDADLIAEIGWNTVRLLISWSRVEPAPGVYDEHYLDLVEEAVRLLEQRGIYTLVDLHQDAWGPSLATRPGEACGSPAFGWDGAPAWATLDEDELRCILIGPRELSPAVVRSFQNFWADAPGPGGVGIQTRYLRMLSHVAARFAPHDAVAGFDVMNEPNAFFFFPDVEGQFTDFTAAALQAVRAGEAEAGAPRRLVLLEPAITWADFGFGAPLPFPYDDQVVYAPHLYQGGISATPLSAAAFQQARDEAAALMGGAPVLSGEWGSDPRRAADPADDYFERHAALQDDFRFGATLWTWREACGDPHKAGDARAGRVPYVWGLFEVDCATNTTGGMRAPLVAALTRPALRAAPGPIGAVGWDPAAHRFQASGDAAAPGASFAVFWPRAEGPTRVEAVGLDALRSVPARGGHRFLVGRALGGPWSLTVEGSASP